MVVGFAWRGKGWLVAVITFICSLLAELISEGITQDDSFYQRNAWPMSVALGSAAIITFFLPAIFRKWDGEPPAGQPHRSHRLFFISVDYWGWILAGFAIMNLFIPR